MKRLKDLSCWIVTEGMAGTENQCIGVANALGVTSQIFKSGLKQPWATFSPWLGLETRTTFDINFIPPWPDILITSGRKAIAAARYIKKQSAGKTFTVHLQDPRVNPNQFDLVAVPYHDPTRGENVIVTDTAPNKITDQALLEAKNDFKQFAQYTSPVISVLIGGKSKAYEMTQNTVSDLISKLQNIQKEHNATLLITASRRTGEESRALLNQAFPNNKQTFFWDGEGDNPYIAFLGYADYILVTADSVSMVSDALSTGTPTYIIPLEGGARRIDLFHRHIIDQGYARKFEGKIEEYAYNPVCASDQIAQDIHKKLGMRRD